MKCLVTGGAGFIGSNLVDQLIKLGHQVIVLDNLSTGRFSNLNKVKNKIKFVHVDVSKNKNSFSKYFYKVDWVFHLAGLADIIPSIKNPEPFFKTNVGGTKNVLEISQKFKIKKLIYAASASCYGIPSKYPTNEKSKIDISQIIKDHKKIISIFPGSRRSEIDVLLPILINFIKMMNEKYNDIFYVFHSTTEFNKLIQDKLIKAGFKNCGSISDEKVKSEVLKSSTFAVAKSGTISLEICNAKVPSIIIYKMNSINFLIIKMLVKVKYANIINIAANEEIIPELLQSNCYSKNIFNNVDRLFENNESMQNQIDKSQEILKNFKTNQSSKIAASVLTNSL